MIRHDRSGATRPLFAALAGTAILAGCSLPTESTSESLSEEETSPLRVTETPTKDAVDLPASSYGALDPGSADINGAFLLSRGKLTPLPDVPVAAQTSHTRTNNLGQVAGSLVYSPTNVSGFLWDIKGVTDAAIIDVPGAVLTAITGLNDHAQVVGAYAAADAGIDPALGEVFTRGFKWEDGCFTYIDFPGAVSTGPYEINNRGLIVGNYSDQALVQHGFIITPEGEYVTVDHPLATTQPNVTTTRLTGVNDRGAIVGSYGDDAGVLHAFTRDKQGNFTTIDPPGAIAAEATGINDRGWIVGRYLDATPMLRGFLLTEQGFKLIDIPGRCDTATFAIDDRGRILIPRAGAIEGTTCFADQAPPPADTTDACPI